MSGEPDLEQLKLAIGSGAAICLLGAGFSRAGKDSAGTDIPGTEDLTDELKKVLGIDPAEVASLSDVADFAHDDADLSIKLRKYLLQRLTVTQPSAAQQALVSLPWRSIFTTNFDDLVEQASISGRLTPVTPATKQETIPGIRTPLYYMHGRARDLLETDIDPGFVISETNYIELERKNRDLYARLNNEVFSARAILIVGYSLRDLDVARGFLSQSSVAREKTYIVCHSSDGLVARSRLRKFGTVVPIGVDGIAQELELVKAPSRQTSENFQFLHEVKPTPSMEGLSSEDFIRLIIRGQVDSDKYLRQLQDKSSGDRFCVERTQAVAAVLDGSDNLIRRYIVSSDFGNGKTVFLRELAIHAVERGHRVAVIDTKLAELFPEIDAAFASGDRFLFIVDDVVRYREVARYIGARLTNLTTLVCTTRGDQEERAFDVLSLELGGAVRHVDLNQLNQDEIAQWDQILERWGYWGTRIEHSQVARQDFIRKECGSENRSVILSLFRDSKIAERIDRIVDFFLREKREHIVSFAALLVASLGQRHISWESLVSWLDIREDKLRADLATSEVAYLFQGGRNWNAFTSSQLAEFILRNRFVASDRDVLVSTFSTIVLKTAESANDSRSGFDHRENLKELMKFRFLTRLFGDDEDAVSLIGSVYKRLSNAPRIRDNPQFWLQYAMSKMEVNDLAGAEKYLETALGLAKGRGADYSPFQILDQRARLYLKKNANKIRFSPGEIRIAIRDLTDLSHHKDYESIYPFRAVPLIRDFLINHIDDVEPELRQVISVFLEQMRDVAATFHKLPRSQKGETKVLVGALSEARLLIHNA